MGEEDSGPRRDSPTPATAAAPRHRILCLAPFTPRSDAMHGGGRIVAQLLLRLARRNRVGLVYLRGPGTAPIEPALEEACELAQEIVPRRHRHVGGKKHRIDVLRAPLTGLPSPVAAVHDRGFAAACRTAVLGWTPDIVQVEQDTLAYLGPVVRRASADVKLILTCHEPGPSAAADLVRTTQGRQRLAHGVDRKAWQRYWSRTLGAFDVVVTFTDRDRSVVTAANPSVRTVAIPFGIDIPDAPLSAVGGDEPRILFVGGYMHPPNSDAALRLLRSIMPAVRRRLPELRLILAGADPGPEMLGAAGPDDLITGTVAETMPFLRDASVVALPIRLGGGMRVKLLEAMAAGKAVVTSRLAAAGLELSDGVQVVFAESDEEFCDAIIRLIGDAGERGRLGAEARRWAVSNLGWDGRVRRFESLYREMLGAAPR
jgi:glycosyltransferase involved in cell wall biosynthesis